MKSARSSGKGPLYGILPFPVVEAHSFLHFRIQNSFQRRLSSIIEQVIIRASNQNGQLEWLDWEEGAHRH